MSEYSENQLQQWAQQDDEQRFELFLALVVKNKSVWVLSDSEGCLMISAEDGQYLPAWPLKAFAEQAAVDEWQGMVALEVGLEAWLTKWTPGMTDDGYEVAVFPNHDGESIVLSPEELAVELKLQAKKAPIL